MDPATATLVAEVGIEVVKAVANNIESHGNFKNKNRKLIIYYANKTKTHHLKISELTQISGRCDKNLECRWFGQGTMGATLHCEGDNTWFCGTSGTFKISAKEVSSGRIQSAYINFSNPYAGCCKIGYSYQSAAQADINTQDGYSKEVDLGTSDLPLSVYLTQKNEESTPTFTVVARSQ